MKPIIAVMPLFDDEKNSLWMLPGYFDGLSKAGALPVMPALTIKDEDIDIIVNSYDGFLFTGGHDISPYLYNEEKNENCDKTCPIRDEMEIKLLKKALKLNKPVLGICRGIQIINAVLGGTLYQDLPSQRNSLIEHHQAPPYEKPIHRVEIIEDTPLYSLLEIDELKVNSYHHQAIKELSPLLKPMAISPDNIIEAVYMPDKSFVWGVQWHPEFSFKFDVNSNKIFSEFVKSAKK